MTENALYRGSGGGLHRFALPLSPAFAAQEAKGLLVRVDEQPTHAPSTGAAVAAIDEVVAVVDSLKDTTVTVDPPERTDPKSKWVAYALASGLTEADAKAMTKAELINKFGR